MHAMHDITTLTTAVTHLLYHRLASTFGTGPHDDGRPGDIEREPRDRGAVSLEQVLWFVAAGVSVAVIAAIVWNTIETEANTPVTPPTAP